MNMFLLFELYITKKSICNYFALIKKLADTELRKNFMSIILSNPTYQQLGNLFLVFLRNSPSPIQVQFIFPYKIILNYFSQQNQKLITLTTNFPPSYRVSKSPNRRVIVFTHVSAVSALWTLPRVMATLHLYLPYLAHQVIIIKCNHQ